jgi:hypothetical protein
MRVNPRNREGVIKVEVYKSIYENISKIAESQGVTIKDFVNGLLESYIATTEHLKKRFSELSQVGSTDTAILVEDKGENAIASITMKIEDGTMFCSICKRDFCEHIFRSLLSPDWVKIMANLDRAKQQEEATGKEASKRK